MKTLSVILTYRCTAACSNCGTFSTPRVKETGLPYAKAREAILGAGANGFLNVVFTGGEATLKSVLLLRLIGLAQQCKLPARLVTNGHWAPDDLKADRFVGLLAAKGLSEINFSTGPEHERYVSVDNIVHGAVASVKAGIRTVVMIEIHRHRKDAASMQDSIRDRVEARLQGHQRSLLSFVQSPWMPVSPHRAARSPDDILLNKDNAVARHGCDSVLQTYVLQADNKWASCCGLGMRFIDELHSPADTGIESVVDHFENDLMKQALRYIGPEKLLAWIADRAEIGEWENRYSHKCHACLRLYKDDRIKTAFHSHRDELLVEVIKSRFLQELTVSTFSEGFYDRN